MAAKERQILGAPVQVIVRRKPDGDEVSQLVGARDSTILALRDIRRRGAVWDVEGLSRAAVQPPIKEGNDATRGGPL
jgi:hypothetical protein